LGIPVATVLVATQLKLATNWGEAAWINSAILAGVWVFAVLMVFVMRNQRHTLDTDPVIWSAAGFSIQPQPPVKSSKHRSRASAYGVFLC
jgi:hypothetical protein